MRFNIKLFAALIGVAAISVFVTRGLRVAASPQVNATSLAAAVGLPEYSASFESHVWQEGGQPILVEKIRKTQTPDGGFAEESQRIARDGKVGYTTRNIFLPSGVVVLIWEELRVAYAVSRPEINASKDVTRFNPATSCATPFSGLNGGSLMSSNESMAGFSFVAARVEHKSSSMRREVWRVPNLACLEVRHVDEFFKPDGTRSDSSEMSLKSLAAGSHTAELFAIPADFEEVTPMAAAERVFTLLGQTMPEATREVIAKRAMPEFNQNTSPSLSCDARPEAQVRDIMGADELAKAPIRGPALSGKRIETSQVPFPVCMRCGRSPLRIWIACAGLDSTAGMLAAGVHLLQVMVIRRRRT